MDYKLNVVDLIVTIKTIGLNHVLFIIHKLNVIK